MDQIVQKIQHSMWRLLAIQKMLLQHEGAVLNVGMRRLDNDNRDLSRTVRHLEEAHSNEKEERVYWKNRHSKLKVQSILFQELPKDAATNDNSALEKAKETEAYIKELQDEIAKRSENEANLEKRLQAVCNWAEDFSVAVDIRSPTKRICTPKENPSSYLLQDRLKQLRSNIEGEFKRLDTRIDDWKSVVEAAELAEHETMKNGRPSLSSPRYSLRDIADHHRLSPSSLLESGKGESVPREGSPLQMILDESLIELERQIFSERSASRRPSSTSTTSSTISFLDADDSDNASDDGAIADAHNEIRKLNAMVSELELRARHQEASVDNVKSTTTKFTAKGQVPKAYIAAKSTDKYSDILIHINNNRLVTISMATIARCRRGRRRGHAPRKNPYDTVIVYIEAIRAKGVSVQGKPLFPGTKRHLRWGEVITGGQDEGNELFGYTFRSTDKLVGIQGEHAKYTIGNKAVASGMYSRVYRATYGDNEECECACKHIYVLSREMTKEERENITHEINLLKSMQHENIVRFIDVAQEQYDYYIFTEMIHGTTLHDHYIYQRNIFTELETRNIFQQICEAVNYLHHRGIVHRDIKSENVMVTDDGRVKLIDFGLARTTSSNEVLSNRCGTRAYMAPEADQSEECNNGYGKAVDVWSLGVLLFRMLAGVYPFEEEHSVTGDISQQSSVAITDQTGVERMDKESPSSQPSTKYYDRDWRQFVDREETRSPDVKSLLEGMLTIDPSRRLTIQGVLRSDWMRMIDEELAKFDRAVPNYGEFSGARPSSGTGPNSATNDDEKPWGELNIVPGSMKVAPRKIILAKEKYWIGRNSQADIRVGSHRGVSQMHCMIFKKQNDLPEDSDLSVEQRRKEEIIMVADGSHNGTYVNLMKVDHGKAVQIVDGDILGLVVPFTRDPDNLQDNWFNESLKYQVTLYSKLSENFNPAKRRYEACEDIPERNKTRVLEARNRGSQWGELVDEDDPTKKYALAGSPISIGRDRKWDGMYPYIENKSAKNATWVSNQRLYGRVQLRNNDVIMLALDKGDSKKAAYTIKFQRFRRE
ncbi:Ribosomal protein S6 kinase alpha-5 [Podila epicladia]|nr:Ribosomal protein S6 kinase alpha-5 [Podila epicladia]